MNEKFIEFMKDNGLSQNTYNSYATDIKLFEKYYKDSYGEDLKELIHSDIVMYINYLRNANYSVRTINRKLTALKQYNLLLQKERIQKDIVIREKDYIKIQKSMIQKRIPTKQEINKLRHFSSKDKKNSKRDYCLITLLIYAGLRESEIVSIKLNDIDLENHLIKIIGKGNKFRQVIINDIMFDAMVDYLAERRQLKTNNDYLFTGQKNINTKQPLNRNFCNRILNKYQELCKIGKLHPHLLRAYFCSNALHNAGYSIEQVANQAGHSSLNTTKEYLVTEQENLVALANKL
jgi:integrase/recombinase XerD